MDDATTPYKAVYYVDVAYEDSYISLTRDVDNSAFEAISNTTIRGNILLANNLPGQNMGHI